MVSSFRTTVTAAALLALCGCSMIAEPPPTEAEARLRTGTLPETVPPAPRSALLQIAQDNFRTGNFGYAARYYEQAAAAGIPGAEVWLGLAASYDRLRRFDLADRAYIEAARHAGGTAAYHNNVGFSYLLRGEAEKAQRSLLRALDLAPGAVAVLNNLELLRQAVRDGGHPGAPGLGQG